jgi:hypothetical protein
MLKRGRPKGSKNKTYTDKTEIFAERCTPKKKKYFKKCSKEYKE